MKKAIVFTIAFSILYNDSFNATQGHVAIN